MKRRASDSRQGPRSRGQAMILGVVSLVVLALVVFMTINVTVSVQQKIRLQNYADAKAFSMAVMEARALNYFAYSNRAIASSYVSMANVHAYVSEATMLTDLRFSGALVMQTIAAEELAQCFCGWVPCRPQHCLHAAEAEINVAGLFIDAFGGKIAKKVQAVDRSARGVTEALDRHIRALNVSQKAVHGGVMLALGKGSFGSLKEDNMSKAASVTSDPMTLSAQNIMQWTQAFETNDQKKRRILAENVNATRQDFAWNRTNSLIATPVLFARLSDLVKAETLWVGPKGTWIIEQFPGGVSGRTGVVAAGNFPGQSGATAIITRDVAANVEGKSMTSFDHGLLGGTWRHGVGGAPLPMLGPIGVARITTGASQAHASGLFSLTGNPHTGASHSNPELAMERFMEFNIGDSFPFNQPAVFATATTDGRVNEFGNRGPYEIAKDGTGTVRFTNVGNSDASLTLTNNSPTKAFSKAQVYYHRMGDWSDYPNLFNPYWRAKLHPVTTRELATTLTIVDSNAAIVVGGASAIPGSGGKGVNVQ
ncbi:hypothetical protein [Melittangium boletus]|uniref:hypothetical protein n=1 Tax=Melittangium boletus TaxID=83453 RepID=UPI003DA46247